MARAFVVHFALGSGGCTIGELLVKDFSFSEGIFGGGATPIAESDVTLAPTFGAALLGIHFSSAGFSVTGSRVGKSSPPDTAAFTKPTCRVVAYGEVGPKRAFGYSRRIGPAKARAATSTILRRPSPDLLAGPELLARRDRLGRAVRRVRPRQRGVHRPRRRLGSPSPTPTSSPSRTTGAP